jgi:hypothetical protein
MGGERSASGHVANSNRIAFWVESASEVDRAAEVARLAGAADMSGPKSVGQKRRVATRSLFPSGASKPHSRPARPSSSTGMPNSFENRVANKEHRRQPDKRPRRDSSHTHSSPERFARPLAV